MNKYHYEALVDLFLGCTFILIAGQIYYNGDHIAAYAFAAYSGFKLIGWIRNETKAKEEARK